MHISSNLMIHILKTSLKVNTVFIYKSSHSFHVRGEYFIQTNSLLQPGIFTAHLFFFSMTWGYLYKISKQFKAKILLYIFSLCNCVFIYDIYICWIWTPNLGFYKTLAINELISNTISKPWTNKNQGIRVIRVYATLILRQQYVS